MRRTSAQAEHDFEALFREHAAAVYRTLYAFTAGRRPIAEEATAEAFARAVAHADRIRDPVPWVYRTAFRIAVEELRRELRTPPEPDRGVAGGLVLSPRRRRGRGSSAR